MNVLAGRPVLTSFILPVMPVRLYIFSYFEVYRSKFDENTSHSYPNKWRSEAIFGQFISRDALISIRESSPGLTSIESHIRYIYENMKVTEISKDAYS